MKILRYLAIITIAASTLSCGKWLDVYPKSEISSGKVFENADGYYSALSGLYVKMSDDELYGFDMTCGFIDMMGGSVYMNVGNLVTYQANNFYNNPSYAKMVEPLQFPALNYYRGGIRVANTDKVTLTWWKGLYSIIINANILIEQLRKEDAGMFEPGVKDLMLGEALAIRAYCHLDLVRIFQLPYLSENGKTDKRIPYMDRSEGLQFVPSSTTDEILSNLNADLSDAAHLMKDKDPISSSKRYYTPMYSSDRRYKLNYYAVKTLQARTLLYHQKNKDAYDAAIEVINGAMAAGIRFVTDADLAAVDSKGVSLNRSCPMENLFAVATDEISQNFINAIHSSPTINTRLGNSARYVANRWLSQGLTAGLDPNPFFTSTSDIRPRAWGKTASPPYGQKGTIMIGKYVRESSLDEDIAQYPKQAVTLLKLGEAYLIAAEAAIEAVSPAESKRLLNELQAYRNGGLTTSSSSEELKEELLLEFRRESLGDGQLFYFYKRRNEPKLFTLFQTPDEGGTVFYFAMTPNRYTPGIPDAEYNNGRRH